MAAGRSSVLPGFGLTLGVTLFCLSVVVLIPLTALFLRAGSLGWERFVEIGFSPRVLAAYRLSFGGAFLAALIDTAAGLLVAWVLVRYPFPGRRLADAIVDLPFALPTSVAGIALTALYAPNGPLGNLLGKVGIKVAFSPLGVVVAMVFIGLPFVVRTVQPVLRELDVENEEAALLLGANPGQIFWRVILPTLFPSLMTGSAMAFARAVGEYGSVIFIAGNLPGISEIAPLLIVIKLDQHDTEGATAIAVVMLVAAFLLLLLINAVQHFWREAEQ